ncbi:MAG: dihydrolipoyl dehydrogenase [Candidatus Gygaella obscura]|nr:dihydrolipoyl dehydrogenase [Candidatus Gygaella obscura]
MKYNLAIIGAGWAGFNAACEATDLGLSVVLIESNNLGGVCLNYGCIPTKVFVQSSKMYSNFKKSSKFAVDHNDVSFNIKTLQKNKADVIERLKKGMNSILKRKQINYVSKKAKIISESELLLDDKEKITFDYLLLATGSTPKMLPHLLPDNKKIFTSRGILDCLNLPKELLVVGAGYIGCELAQMFTNLGTKVSLVELSDSLLQGLDKELSNKLQVIFKRMGMKIYLSSDETKVNLDDFDRILVSVGRKSNIEGLGLEKIGIQIENDKIKVNEILQTNISNVFAAGDCASKYLLAHTASYEGRIAVSNIFVKYTGSASKFIPNYKAVPTCIFTEPQIATIGLNEEDAKKSGYEVKVSKFFFLGSGMAHIQDETEGFVKLVVDKDTDLLLGAIIMGPEASELINIISLTMNNKIKVSNLAKTIFAHPSFSELIIEAARSVNESSSN